MNEITQPERAADSFALSGRAGGQTGMDAVQQVLDQSQTLATALLDFGTGSVSFLGKRVEQDADLLGSMARCQTLPEVLDVEARWWQRAMDDYAHEFERLVEFNANLASGFAARRPAGTIATRTENTGPRAG